MGGHTIAVMTVSWSITGKGTTGRIYDSNAGPTVPNRLCSIQFDHRRGAIAIASRIRYRDTWRRAIPSLPSLPAPLHLLLGEDTL